MATSATTLQFAPRTTSLTERAMTVALHLSAWRAQRLDRKVTDEVLTQRSAEKDAGRFEKHLVPPKALEGVSKAHTAARARHYAMTLPWGDEGVRILSAAAFFDYSTAMAEERSKCEMQYTAFCGNYPNLVAEAPRRLAALYNSEDFPAVGHIRAKFAFALVVLPVPDKDDFRVALGSEIEAQVRKDIEHVVTERAADAQRDLWTRVADTMRHFATTMSDSDKVFRDTTVTKLADLARLAPKLSLTPDPKLNAICDDILTIVNRVSPEQLRTNKLARSASAAKAQAALRQIESAMSGAF